MARSDGGMTSPFVDAVAAAVGDHPVVVALGGGADSAVLLHASARLPTPVRAVFVHQGLTGSDALEAAARRVAEACDVDVEVLAGPIPYGANLEARARDARYRAIEANLAPGELAVTGHTADDQAETVLMRLLRGSGAGGLSGIPAARGPWRRPFLRFTRRELRERADELSLPYADDPDNADDRFLRSRIRHHLLPLLEEGYAPGAVENLVRTGHLLALDDAVLDDMAAGIPLLEVPGGVAIPLAPLLTAPLPVASRAVRAALRRHGDAYPGSMDDVDTALEVARSGSAAHVGGHLHVRVEPPHLVFGAAPTPTPDEAVTLDGIDRFTWCDQRYRVSHARYPTPVTTAGRFTVLSAPADDAPTAVRGLQPGDRIDLAHGSTPVSELLRDAAVPAWRRPCWPLVTVGGMIAAVHGVRTASWAQPHHGDTVVVIEREVRT